MRNTLKPWLVGAALAFAAGQVAGGEDAKSNIRDRLEKMLPGYEITSIHETPVPGVYEVLLGTELVYVSGDGRYMLQGRLVDLETRANLTETSPRLAEAERRQAQERAKTLSELDEDEMIIFAPEDYQYTVTVFTDIDCGYCRKLHREIDGYENEGIRVRYLFFPRAGAGSPSFEKAVSVWCSDDRQQALTDAKAGKTPPKKTCENPVLDQMKLGEAFGVAGTPAIVFDSGALVPGYVPPKRLLALLKADGQ
jgi:thiol:disulfide interchange protein DsbC